MTTVIATIAYYYYGKTLGLARTRNESMSVRASPNDDDDDDGDDGDDGDDNDFDISLKPYRQP